MWGHCSSSRSPFALVCRVESLDLEGELAERRESAAPPNRAADSSVIAPYTPVRMRVASSRAADGVL